VSATDDRQAIEAVVRAFLDAAAQGKFPPDVWAQPLADAFTIGAEIGRSTPVQLPVLSGSAHIRKLEIRSMDGDSAQVDLNAECVTKVDHPVSGQRHVKRVYRDAVLRRDATGWRIASLKQDGVDFAAGMFEPVVARARVDGVDLYGTTRTLKRGYLLGALLRNCDEESAVVERIELKQRVWWLFEDGEVMRQRPLVLRREGTWGVANALKGRLISYPLVVSGRINGRDARLEMRPPPTPFWKRILQCVHSNTIVHAFVVASLLLVPFAPRALGGVGLVLLWAGALNVGGEALALMRASRFSAQVLYVSVGALELAVGAFLVWHERVGVITVVGVLALVAYMLSFHVRGLGVWRKVQAETVRDAPA